MAHTSCRSITERARWGSTHRARCAGFAETSELDRRDARGPVAQSTARATALEQRSSQILGEGARMRDVLGCDPDRVAVGRCCTIVAPARAATTKVRDTRKAVP